MAWYWIVLIVMGYLMIGGIVAYYMLKEGCDGFSAALSYWVWPLIIPLILAFIIAQKIFKK